MRSLFNPQSLATASAGIILGAIGAWLAAGGPLFQSLLMALLVLYVMDTVLGVCISVWGRGEKFSSLKFRRVSLKMMHYLALISLAYVVDSIIGKGMGSTVHWYVIEMGAVLSIVTHEALSVLEHLHELEPHTGFKVPAFIGSKINGLREWMPEELQESKQRKRIRKPAAKTEESE